MPFGYRDATDQNALKARICERVMALGSLAAACREAGMPHHETVRRWMADDVSFGAALEAARRKGWFARKWAFDEGKALRVLAHLREGGSLKKLPKGPEWPTVGAVKYWRGADGAFGAEVLRIQAMFRGNRGRPLGRRAAAFDRTTADRVILAVGRGGRMDRLEAIDPSLPGRGLIRRWRAEDRDFAVGLAFAMKVGRAARRRNPPQLTPKLRREIIMRIREGASLSSLGEEPGMPGKGTLYGWIGRNQAFAEAVMAACDDREHWWSDQVGMAMDDAGGTAELKALIAPIMRGWARHQNRPGRKWR